MKNSKVFALIHVIGIALLMFGAASFSSCKVTLDGDSDYRVYGTVEGEYKKGLSNIVVYISLNGGNDKQITLTAEDGWFEFKELKRGSYTVTFFDINEVYQTEKRNLSLTEDFNFATVRLSKIKSKAD